NLEKPEDDCIAVAYQCESYDAFLEGRCANCADYKCQPMGLNPDYWIDKKMDERTVDSRYFVNTGPKEEYCLYHYQMGFHISNNSDSTTVEKIHSIALEWKRYNASERSRYNRGYKLQIPVIEIYYMSSMNESIRDESSAVFCPKDGAETRIVANRQKVDYIACNPHLKQKCRDMSTEELKPLTFKEDIHSVDYMRQYPVFHKIRNSIVHNCKCKDPDEEDEPNAATAPADSDDTTTDTTTRSAPEVTQQPQTTSTKQLTTKPTAKSYFGFKRLGAKSSAKPVVTTDDDSEPKESFMDRINILKKKEGDRDVTLKTFAATEAYIETTESPELSAIGGAIFNKYKKLLPLKTVTDDTTTSTTAATTTAESDETTASTETSATKKTTKSEDSDGEKEDMSLESDNQSDKTTTESTTHTKTTTTTTHSPIKTTKKRSNPFGSPFKIDKSEDSDSTEASISDTKPRKSLIGKINILSKIKKDKSEKSSVDKSLKTFSDTEPEVQSKVGGFLVKFKQYQDMLGKSCFRDIGCFSPTEYNESARAIPLLPMSPDSMSPMFHMYTLEQRTIPRNYSYNATAAQLRYSTFNASLRTAFIVHGFQSGYALWLENMKDFILYKSNDQFNVVVVIWEKGAKTPIYNLAATNTRVVGALIGFFINSLCNTFKITNDRFWLIGHSLGGHTMGYAGKRLNNPKVGRITALDPAGVGFHFKNTALRLDHSDAQIVDVIHTDAALSYTEGFGTADTLGHFDFYPNGGSWQPGCAVSDSVTNKLSSITSGEDITCSHSRACLIMNNLDKPEDDCSAIAYQCESYDAFLEGRCASCEDNKCQPMGLNPEFWIDKPIDPRTIDSRYFVNTAPKEDYCYLTVKIKFIMCSIYHYQMGFHISNNSDSTTVEKIHSLALEWKRYNASERSRYNRGYKLQIPVIEYYYMSSVHQNVRDGFSGALCPKDGPQTRITVNRQKVLYSPCSPTLKSKARDMSTEELKPLTFKEDIHSVDYMRQYPVYHKIRNSMVANSDQTLP
ncbi:unnamed protein product, partial [Medioppia subpectinata]